MTRRLSLACAWLLSSWAGAAPFETVEYHGMPFVGIPAGQFVMGTTAEQRKHLEDSGWWNRFLTAEQPAHRVVISRPFFMGKTEVTQGQWQKIMNSPPENVSRKGDSLPVDSVSFADVRAFLERLNQLGPERFRLPTEAEWEYCCRAGDWGLFQIGEDGRPVTVESLPEYVWMKDNAARKTQPVGTKKPNAWGLHDMLGNLWEWCGDYYGREAFAARGATTVNPFHERTFPERVLKGGSWFLPVEFQRASLRSGRREDNRSVYVGFRLVCEPLSATPTEPPNSPAEKLPDRPPSALQANEAVALEPERPGQESSND